MLSPQDLFHIKASTAGQNLFGLEAANPSTSRYDFSVDSSNNLLLKNGSATALTVNTAGQVGVNGGIDTNYALTASGVKSTNSSAQPAGYFSNAGTGLSLQTDTGGILLGSLAGIGSRTVVVDASGNLSAVATPAMHSQTFTSNATWTLPLGVSVVWITMCGGGGGGGGGGSSTTWGGGGGGSGMCYLYYPILVSGNVSVVVGGGGAGASYGYNGNNGGASSFGSFTTCGGNGGTSSNSSGGIGGSTCVGGAGGSSYAGTNGASAYGGNGAAGYGSTISGVSGGTGANDNSSIFNGGNGTGYGSGGGGGGGTDGYNTTGKGGNGTSGIVIVQWWQ
ncbi:MAG: glycine-rich domain-containing protein [Ignavibacteriaceae bacterium]